MTILMIPYADIIRTDIKFILTIYELLTLGGKL